MNKVLGLIAAVLFVFQVQPANSLDRVIRLTNGEFPPYLTEGVEGYGVASRIVSEAFAVSGHIVEYGFFPWKRSMILAERGEWDGTVVWSWSKERDRLFFYSDPVIVSKEVFFHRKTRSFSWDTYSDLSGFRIGATIGYFYGNDFQKAEDSGLIKVDRSTTDYYNLRKLTNGRIDLSLVEMNVGLALLHDQLPQYSDIIVAHADKPARITTLHLLISRQVKNGKALIATFNKGLTKIRDTGRVDELFRKANLERHSVMPE